ncbi:MAG TPA: GNAT family N-acetyltransferase, partial [Anaerolineales bacterium]|nr:GNAT family N-acetyltransferase [Anaerolineales bacterium]
LIVEDTTTGQIVSTTCLIPQTWTYAGVPFEVGRPELVGTLPEYRNRGLVRRQFEVVHQWCVERGQLVQAITGIPWYYRQFGYEMTVNLSGTRIGFGMHVPGLKNGETEPY